MYKQNNVESVFICGSSHAFVVYLNPEFLYTWKFSVSMRITVSIIFKTCLGTILISSEEGETEGNNTN